MPEYSLLFREGGSREVKSVSAFQIRECVNASRVNGRAMRSIQNPNIVVIVGFGLRRGGIREGVSSRLAHLEWWERATMGMLELNT